MKVPGGCDTRRKWCAKCARATDRCRVPGVGCQGLLVPWACENCHLGLVRGLEPAEYVVPVDALCNGVGAARLAGEALAVLVEVVQGAFDDVDQDGAVE